MVLVRIINKFQIFFKGSDIVITFTQNKRHVKFIHASHYSVQSNSDLKAYRIESMKLKLSC